MTVEQFAKAYRILDKEIVDAGGVDVNIQYAIFGYLYGEQKNFADAKWKEQCQVLSQEGYQVSE